MSGQSTFDVDGFLEFTDHERRMLAAIAKAGAKMDITLLMDLASAPYSPRPIGCPISWASFTAPRRRIAGFIRRLPKLASRPSSPSRSRATPSQFCRTSRGWEREFVPMGCDKRLHTSDAGSKVSEEPDRMSKNPALRSTSEPASRIMKPIPAGRGVAMLQSHQKPSPRSRQVPRDWAHRTADRISEVDAVVRSVPHCWWRVIGFAISPF